VVKDPREIIPLSPEPELKLLKQDNQIPNKTHSFLSIQKPHKSIPPPHWLHSIAESLKKSAVYWALGSSLLLNVILLWK
jgi:hypothetical protein